MERVPEVFCCGVFPQPSKWSSFERSEDWPNYITFQDPDVGGLWIQRASNCDVNLKLREEFLSGIRPQPGVAAVESIALSVRRLGV
jgi:hypothetical protein